MRRARNEAAVNPPTAGPASVTTVAITIVVRTRGSVSFSRIGRVLGMVMAPLHRKPPGRPKTTTTRSPAGREVGRGYHAAADAPSPTSSRPAKLKWTRRRRLPSKSGN